MYAELLAVIDRVRELHKEDDYGQCSECKDKYGDPRLYPCRTIQVLEGTDE